MIRFYDPVSLALVTTYSYGSEFGLMTSSSGYGSSMVLGVPNLRPGDYLMHVSPRHPGSAAWRPQWYDRATSPEGAQPVTLTAAGEVVLLPLVLELGGVVRGTVLMDPDAPKDYYIIVTPAGDRTTWGYSYAWDLASSFEVLGLPDGDFKIGACPIGANSSWAWPDPAPAETRWFPGGVAWDDAGVITIVDGGDVEGLELAGE